jgi:hypothetical protein
MFEKLRTSLTLWFYVPDRFCPMQESTLLGAWSDEKFISSVEPD